MKKILIFGIGNFADAMVFWINKYTDWEIVGFVLDSAYKNKDTHNGLKIFEFENLEHCFNPNEYEIVLTLGYGKMNDSRRSKYLEIKKKGYVLPNFIHPSVIQDFNEIGEGNIILENVILGAFVEIGNCNIIFGNCHIAHGSKLNDYNFLSCNVLIGGETKVGNNCFLGLNCVIKSAKNISDYTFVGMGACVGTDTDAYSVYVPERTKKLDKDPFEMMGYVVVRR